jgi:hypothetical protein
LAGQYRLIIIVALVASASIALAITILYIPQLQPKSSSGTALRFDNETFFRSAAPFGHKLAVVSPYGGSEGSIGVGNPSSSEFKNCTIVLESVVGEGMINATVKTYSEIPPHSYDYFTIPLTVYNTDDVPGLIILECKEPRELATTPGIFIGKRDYMPGETVTIKGMLGHSQVTLSVMDADGKTILERKLATNNGFLESAFQVPKDAGIGMWTVQVDTHDIILGQDFRVIGENGEN